MSSTNKTTYYNLSQFANTDKPSWLNDYNNDMTIIDTNLKLNANNISTNSTNINANTNSIGDLTSLTTTDKSTLVNAINEVASSSSGSCKLHLLDITTYSRTNPIILEDLELGSYLLYYTNTDTSSTKTIYIKNKSTDSNSSFSMYTGAILNYYKTLNSVSTTSDSIGNIQSFYTTSAGVPYMYVYDLRCGNMSNRYLYIFGAGYSLITNNNKSAIGNNYNSSAIQYLKNENGTINWVTESNVTPSMIYLGKINAYNSSANALDLSNYPAGTRIVLKHNDSSRSFYIKVGTNTAQVPVSTDDNTAVVNNIYYVDVNSISGATASVAVIWASTYEWCPLVTNTIMVSFTSSGASVGNNTRNMQILPYFQLEEDTNGDLNTTTLQQFINVREVGITKTKAQQRTAIQYVDKDKNNILLTYKSHTSGSQQIYEGTGIMKVANASGLYECYRITLEINYSGLTYSNYQVTKTRLGVVFDETAISGYSSTGTKTLSLNNGVLEWV